MSEGAVVASPVPPPERLAERGMLVRLEEVIDADFASICPPKAFDGPFFVDSK